MARHCFGNLLIGTIFGAGIVGAGVLAYGQLSHRPGGSPMNEGRFTAVHVQRTTDKSFEEVVKAFERQVGTFDPEVYKTLSEGGDPAATKKKLEAMAGPSGFMLFRTSDHGALLRLVGQKRKALQYLVGNPLIAIQMTQHDLRASLYAPLRVLVYENEAGKTCVEYDQPTSLFGQFGNAEINVVASGLDQKLEHLVDESFR